MIHPMLIRVDLKEIYGSRFWVVSEKVFVSPKLGEADAATKWRTFAVGGN